MPFRRSFAAAVVFALSLHAAEDKLRLVRETNALTPEQERAGFHVPPGFEVQLFASEPMINKPINMAFDARGRLWVSSTVEYPYAADKARWSDEKGTRVKDSRDAIKILEDTDGDGKADKVTDFADGLNIPTGVLPWHKPEHKAGCIAWSIPNLWYFADADGDGKADLREVLFGPLGYEKDTHGMCSSFRLGLDGWVYATHGFNNTSKFKVRRPTENTERTEKKNADFVLSVNSAGDELELHSGNVFRFKPDGSRVEIWTRGQVNPFGLCWDRFGNLYSADCHSSPIYQLIRGACYPSFGKPHDGLGFAPVMCEHSHGSTGICGIVYIDGGVWGPEWDDHTFVGNPVTSMVNHDKITFTGSTPKANEQPDFITSDDPWFRPVDLQLGPDNALYIADFYNKIIGHYEVPLEHPGRDKERGRIWRVVKKDTPALQNRDLTTCAPELLFKELDSPNLTRRWMATRLLPTRFKADENPQLSHLLQEQVKTELAAAQALWVGRVREQMGSGFPESETKISGLLDRVHWAQMWASKSNVDGKFPFMQLLADWGKKNQPAHPQIQRAIVNAFASFSGRNALNGAEALSSMYEAVPANDESLRHSILVTMRHLLQDEKTLEEALKVFEAIQPAEIVRDKELTAVTRVWEKVMLSLPYAKASEWLMRLETALTQDPLSIATRLTHIARHGDPALLPKVIALAKQAPLQDSTTPFPLLIAIHNGLSERGAPANAELLQWAQELAARLLLPLENKPEPVWVSLSGPDNGPKWSLQTRKCADGAEAQVLQSMMKGGGDEERRTGVLRSKPFDAPAKLTFWINGHCGFPQAKSNDRNVVRVVDAKSGTTIASVFPPRNDVCQRAEFDLSKHAGKAVRLEIADGDDGKSYAWLGITRIEPAVVSVNDFQSEGTAHEALKKLATMLQHTAPAALREKLAAYLPPRPAPPPLPVSPEQRKQLDALIAARVAAFAKTKPDVLAGKNAFKTHCAVCHQIKGEGGLIGPQLEGIGVRGVERLCEDILDPNRNVDAHFHLHTLTLKDGTTMGGFLKAEVGQVLVLADAAGQEHRVSKSDLVKDDTTPMSLMPPVFGQTISEGDFANLLGFLLTQSVTK